VAGRVGLVACGNLELALASSMRRADLLRFTVSPELGEIRQALGVSVS
jgi:hypothetical protein